MRHEIHTNPGNLSPYKSNAKPIPPAEAVPFSELADYFSQGRLLLDAARVRNLALKMDPPVPSSFGFSSKELLILQGEAAGKSHEEIRDDLNRLRQRTTPSNGLREATLGTVKSSLGRINETVERAQRSTHAASATQVALAESVHEGTIIAPIPEAADPLYVGRRAEAISLIANLGEPLDILHALGARTVNERPRVWEELARGLGARSRNQVYAIAAALFART